MQGWLDATAIGPKNLFEDDEVTTPSVAQMPTRSCQASRGEANSSNEESNSHNQLARRTAAGMYGGSDPFTSPGGTRQPPTHDAVSAMTMVAFKPKIDLKLFAPCKDKTKWIQWWNHFKIMLRSQGMEAALDADCTPGEPDEVLGFVRMQNTVSGASSEQIQMPADKFILRQHLHTRNA
jgi:hypothetical protein